MAFQHFYSRVPARISLYKKTDGFDTFAHSAELERDFIERDLAPLYENKLQKNDFAKVRRGEIPTVYCQTVLRSGKTAQSALTYLPLDYTGERSAYMVHTLVLTDEERSLLFANKDASVFNPYMFVTNIASFNITAPNAVPNKNYPPKQYMAPPLVDAKKITSQYDSDMVRTFIYAVILAVCGKGKNIYFRLPTDDKHLSTEALRFINAILSILPYSIRELLSFVTYVSDINQYPGIRLKCVNSEISEVPSAKGVFFDFESNLITGLPDDIDINNPLITFLYSLLGNVDVRDKFHHYVANILMTYEPKMLNLKILNEIVFLFWQCSGIYLESTVLPNDNLVYEFLNVYEKYRDALSIPYRTQAYKCLERYPRDHVGIPKNIFNKLTKLYPTEDKDARRVALNVILHLIHTDIMREKLFGFIKSNYDDESDEVKAIINIDLCRVFYGGFLQSDLLDFFNEHFRDEPLDTRNAVLDKMLLTIRTVAVQDKIITFLDNHYEEFTWEMRLKIYSTYFEMLPECDRLSALMIDLVNKHIHFEKDDFRKSVASKLSEFLEANYKKSENLMLPILVDKPGFSDDVVVTLLFGNLGLKKMYKDYVTILTERPAQKKAQQLIHIYKLMPKIQDDVYLKLLKDCKPSRAGNAETTMYDLIEADSEAEATLPEKFLGQFREMILYPAIIGTLYDVFKVRYGKEGIETLLKYSEGRSVITESAQYKTITDYIKFTEFANAGDTTEAFKCLAAFPTQSKVRRDISEHIRMCSLNRNVQSEKTTFLYELSINILKDANFRFDVVYTQYRNSYAQDYNVKTGVNANPTRVSRESSLRAITLLMETAIDICRADERFIPLVCTDESGIGRPIQSFILTYGMGAGKLLLSKTQFAPTELKEMVNVRIKQAKPQGNNIFFKLFSKK